MRIGFAQLNPIVGDIPANANKIFEAYRQAVDQGAELVLTSELVLTGYPPQDLVFRSGFVDDNLAVLAELHRKVGRVPLLVGYVDYNPVQTGKPFVNACAVLVEGQPIHK
ncbi:MAG: NAD+ synthase, partial [Verrucomicrobia bacterium]|nr:NAD+ synthase [Verrucomicrobiota bacterium]